jgi:hypothetical protein
VQNSRTARHEHAAIVLSCDKDATIGFLGCIPHGLQGAEEQVVEGEVILPDLEILYIVAGAPAGTARPEHEGIAARAAKQSIEARSANQAIVSASAIDRIITTRPPDLVMTDEAVDGLGPVRAPDQIVASRCCERRLQRHRPCRRSG